MHSVLMVHDLISVTHQSLYKTEMLAAAWKLNRNTTPSEFVCLHYTKKQ